ncbi:MAG: SDR family oxidoreductase [Marinifilaceae bacterium]|jgi:NAD(P)-dependent dehydrogenase (short-subunit alcohol dehydrogenase family)|nr:SDR family oxidoreductase [Marinifilaceae bacterium]
MKKTVLITGTSSGFGKLISKKFHQQGWNVIATMRNPEKETELNQLENVFVTHLDVTNKDSILKSVAEGIEKFGKIDILVNNAGFGIYGPIEDATEEQVRKQMEVNYFGLVNVTKAVLPHFRSNREGVIINFSSVGGRVVFPYLSMYHATKFAVEGLTESLQYELNPFGIKLKLIEPGAYNTDFATRSLDWVEMKDGNAYKPKFNAFLKASAKMLGTEQDPQDVANITYLAATDGSKKLRYPVGADCEQILAAREQMNDIQFNEMIIEQMGL